MPVNIIDTLKPKNGLSFPVVEAIDVFVDGFDNLADAVSHFATDVMIEAINAVLSGKANTSDVNTAVSGLQAQIDQIAQAAGTGSADTEIAQARVGADGTNYQTLKARLDAESNLDAFHIAFTNSGLINPDSGAVVANASYVNTDFIPINTLVYPMKYTLRVFKNIATYALYDENKRFLSAVKSESESLTDVTDTIYPEDISTASYIRFCSNINNYSVIITELSKCVMKADNETIAARIGADETEYESLKQRLDSEKSVLQEQIDSISQATQAFNYAFIEGGLINVDSGAVIANESYVYTDFIPVNSIVYPIKYALRVFKNIATYALYDENKNFISSVATDSSTLVNVTDTVYPEDISTASYIRFCSNKTYNYLAAIVDLAQTNIKIPDASITYSKIANGAVAIEKTNFFVHDENTNFLDKNVWIDNSYIKDGEVKPYDGFFASSKIFLTPGKTYYWGNIYIGYWAVYAADDTIIEYHNINDQIPIPYVFPNNASYIRCTAVNIEQKNNAWIFTTNKQPTDYKLILDPSKVSSESASSNPCEFQGDDICAFTKCLCIGDSLTSGTFNHRDSGATQYVEYDKYSYPRNLERITSLEVTNKGKGGYTSGEWYSSESSTDLSGYDIAIIQLGVNDEIRRNTLGMTIAEWFADDTKCGFSNIIAKLKNENNNIKIFVANIIPARSYHSASYIAFSDYLLNWLKTTYANDKNVIPVDIMQYGHTYDADAYNCGHLSAYGYYRLAKDYKSFVSWYMNANPDVFKEIQFIGTDYWYDNPNA